MTWVVGSMIVSVFVVVAVGAWLRRQLRCEVDDETVDWLFEGYEWLLRHLGGFERFRETEIVIPDDLQLADGVDAPDERAERIFAHIREHAGVAGWPCRLECSADLPVDHETEVSTVGTFRPDVRGGEAIITYHAEMGERADHLVAVLAHEFSHYVLLAAAGKQPGGEELEEELTDLCSVFLGFGVFSTNAALEAFVDDDVKAHEIALDPSLVQFRTLSYLSLPTFAYALAISATLLGCRDEVSEALVLPAKIHFRLATRHIDAHRAEHLARLRTVDGDDVRESPHVLSYAREYLELTERLAELQADLEEHGGRRNDRDERRYRKRRKRPPTSE